MTYRLEFELPGLPRMANIPSGGSHWRHAHSEATQWHHAVRGLVASRKPVNPIKIFSLHLTRYSSVEPDYDGLVRGFKSIVDGLKKAGVIEDDKLSNTGVWICEWERVKPKQGKIKVIVMERGSCIPYVPGLSESQP